MKITFIMAMAFAIGLSAVNELTNFRFYNKVTHKVGEIFFTGYERYDWEVAMHKASKGSVNDNTVVFLGDSIVRGLNNLAVSNNSVNYGVNGDNSSNAIARLPEYEWINNAGLVVISVGINDLAHGVTPSQIESNYRDLIDLIDAPVLISALLPISEEKEASGARKLPEIQRTNELLKSISDSENVWFADASTVMAGADGYLKDGYHIDGLHLSAEGYTELQSWLANTVKGHK